MRVCVGNLTAKTKTAEFSKGSKNMKKIISLLLALAAAASLTACSGGQAETTTAAPTGDVTTAAPAVTTAGLTTAKKEESDIRSFYKEAQSDFLIAEIDEVTVATGTSFEDVVKKLPSEVCVFVPATCTEESKVLFSSDFSSPDGFTFYDRDDTMSVDSNKLLFTGRSDTAYMKVTDPEWATSDGSYTNYAVSATIKLLDGFNGNCGIIVRGSDFEGAGGDDYVGQFIGFWSNAEENSGKLIIGNADGAWHEEYQGIFDHVGDTYLLEILVYNETYVVRIDGMSVYLGDFDETLKQGTAGFRSWNAGCEVENFTVRTLDAADYAEFETGYCEMVNYPVTWTCSDYNSDPGKRYQYGFFGDVVEGIDGKKAQIKVIVIVDPSYDESAETEAETGAE